VLAHNRDKKNLLCCKNCHHLNQWQPADKIKKQNKYTVYLLILILKFHILYFLSHTIGIFYKYFYSRSSRLARERPREHSGG